MNLKSGIHLKLIRSWPEVYQNWFIQSMKLETLVYKPGFPSAPHSIPQEVTPRRTKRSFTLTTRGPPLSPWHVSRPLVPAQMLVWGEYMRPIGVSLDLHSWWLKIGTVVNCKKFVEPNWVRPNPEISPFPVLTSKWGAGRQTGRTYSVYSKSSRSLTIAISFWFKSVLYALNYF